MDDNLAQRHRHGDAWDHIIGHDENGEPMYALRWQDWLAIGVWAAAGLAVWAYGIAWCVS